MELYKRICKNRKCGKEFMGTRTQVYCCPDCRIHTYKPKMKGKSIKKCTIKEVTKQAKELGVSYGQYVAMKYTEERKSK